MKIELAAALAAVSTGLGVVAAAQQPVDRILDAPPAGQVVVELVDGDVTFRGWDRASIEISGRLGASVENLDVSQQGEETRIRVIDRPDVDVRGEQTELFVSVPRGSSLVVMGTNSDFLVADVRGALSVHTVSGDIEAESFGALVDAETVGGDIRISARDDGGEAMLTTVAGEIEVGGPFRVITASTVSGDIELDVLDATMLSLDTTNGDIEVHATFVGAAELAAETINGDVELRVGEEGDLNIDVGTFSGRIETCFDDRSSRGGAGGAGDERRDRDGRQRGRRGVGGELNVVADPDSPRIRVRTLNGDIEICGS